MKSGLVGDAGSGRPIHNPFATRAIRPGALAYWFEDAANSPATLTERFLARHARGQLIGPHGSGKSTLVAALLPALEAAGKRPHRIALHDGQRRILRAQLPARRLTRDDVLVIDGYEQLGWLARWQISRRCRRADCGLLVTAHTDVGFPILFRTDVTPLVARHVIEQLARETPEMVLPAEEAMRRVRALDGNLREVLFALYDEYEARRWK